MVAVLPHRWTRPRQGRLVGGVCAGVARRWRLDPSVVRFAVLALTLAAGAGVLVYVTAWIVLPGEPESPIGPGAPAAGTGSGGAGAVAPTGAPLPPPVQATTTSFIDNLAAVVVTLGLLLVLRASGWWFSDGVTLVGLVAVAGLALVWGKADGADAFVRDSGRAARLAVGVVLVAVGFVSFVALTVDWRTLGQSLVGASVAAVGVALLAAPRLVRLANDLRDERRARIRSEEKAEIAAHLHDGVLQTLALIQRRAADNREVVALARRQERELREWLFGRGDRNAETLAGALAVELAAVEDDHAVPVELVCVGDAPLDEHGRALLAAVREAASNAARHSGADRVDVYVEVEPDAVSAFVRDRGRGFDRATVPADRRGLADSVVARMRRVGGSAVIRSEPGEGTEVRLRAPRRAA